MAGLAPGAPVVWLDAGVRGHRARGAVWGRLRRRGVTLAALLAVLGVAINDASRWVRQQRDTPPPVAAAIDPFRSLIDEAPVTIQLPAGDARIPVHTTAHALRHDASLWRRMTLAEWNTVAEPLRHDSLDRMIDRYRDILMNPRAWDAMDAADWDFVPQPMRTIAYRQMMAYWAGYYHVGADHDLPAGLVSGHARRHRHVRVVVRSSRAAASTPMAAATSASAAPRISRANACACCMHEGSSMPRRPTRSTSIHGCRRASSPSG